MLRRTLRVMSTPKTTHTNAQQEVLEISSAYSLLRMCYRSIDIKVKSRHARQFLQKRLIEQWREHCQETDPEKQRFLMDHAGAFLQALHSSRNPKPGEVVKFQLSRRVAYEEAQRAKAERAKTVHKLPSGAKLNY
ncbi:hypothetical protein, conserved [Trypanosoma cruzi]|uniref:Uncharacterized protein n=1 Tax=Trypanosoma cruzi (strain CL Brener) TaxID=353153 RepID=Q4DNT8_TRYCC|nr:hypothetical protein, conserved [Trypanosoma cruzi]EAN94190.1 hypothetical protein, conserved [Trypanosoma cruzi]KAF8277031.1 hypothetical protein TcBrA4_0124700 [Trypanosoma cruzi]|eukprot:XP_816041.1 hypothetical protein [Trypanosoma cruzi strain CL Brener]